MSEQHTTAKTAREQPLSVSLGESQHQAFAELLGRLEEHHADFRKRIRERERERGDE